MFSITSELLGKCRLKPQWDVTTHILEWQKLNRPTISIVDKANEQLECLCAVSRNVK